LLVWLAPSGGNTEQDNAAHLLPLFGPDPDPNRPLNLSSILSLDESVQQQALMEMDDGYDQRHG
jgi:hypothetical protein